MLELEVLYADLTRKRVPIDQAGDLERSGVLFLVLSSRQGSEPQRSDLVQRIWGQDSYALVRTPAGLVFLDGWLETDHRIVARSIADPHGGAVHLARPTRWEPDWKVIEFEGQSLDRDDWERARLVAEEIS